MPDEKKRSREIDKDSNARHLRREAVSDKMGGIKDRGGGLQ